MTNDGTSSYVYIVQNRLIQASGSTAATLRYDPAGRLYETSAGTAASITRMLYDGDELTAEYNASGTLLRRYVHGSGNDDPLIWYEGAGVASTALRRLRPNHQGSIVAVTNTAGAKLNINSYDEWGIPAAANIGRFQYTGQAWLPEIGMYYYKARIYSPTLGRFMQTDPIGYDDQVNLYAYVGNDPVNMVDPTGEKYEVTYHQVAPYLSSARHAAIRFTPDNQSLIVNNKQFNNVDSDGNRYVVISAGPVDGKLESAPNRSSDLGTQEGSVPFAIPKGKSEFGYFNDMARADGNYDDGLDYDLKPAQEGKGQILVPDDGYNSNSFVSGLLKATGVVPPKIPNVVLPGYDKPVPTRCFRPGESSC